jgi:hypothetical protein
MLLVKESSYLCAGAYNEELPTGHQKPVGCVGEL